MRLASLNRRPVIAAGIAGCLIGILFLSLNVADIPASSQPAAPGTLVVTKVLSGDALGQQGRVVVRSECNGFTFSPDLIVPAGSTATSSTRTFFGQAAGATCTVTETVDGAVPGVTVQVIGSPQTVTIPSGSAVVVLISDIFSVVAPPTTTTTTTPGTTTTTTEPATTTTTVSGTTTTTTPGETTTTALPVATVPGATTVPGASVPGAPTTLAPVPVGPAVTTPAQATEPIAALASTGASHVPQFIGIGILALLVGLGLVLFTRSGRVRPKESDDG